MPRLLTIALACALSACGTLQTAQTLHPELAEHAADVVAFTQCADILGSPLVKHFQGAEKLSIAEIIDLALETIRCGNHVQVDALTEEAKSVVNAGPLAASRVVVVPAVPASDAGHAAPPPAKHAVELDPNPYDKP